MKTSLIATLTALTFATLSAPAFAGDIAAGEKDFRKCKACHSIVDDSGEALVKGGKTGPNLYGVVGRTAGSVEGFRYKDSIVALGETGFVWDEASIAEYVVDPNGFLKDKLGDSSAKSGMVKQSLKVPEDVVAYIASLSQ
jgi:cytochrome c